MVGVLLAAGRGRRFDSTGARNKLLATVHGEAVASRSARALAAAVDRTIAVVGPHSGEVASMLAGLGCDVEVCADADEGMGTSLAHAVRVARAWAPRALVVMLADMPHVRAGTIRTLVDAVSSDDDIVAPEFRGQRGHPVVFGRAHVEALARCRGERGAAPLLARHAVRLVSTDDAGVVGDVDTPDDLARTLQ